MWAGWLALVFACVAIYECNVNQQPKPTGAPAISQPFEVQPVGVTAQCQTESTALANIAEEHVSHHGGVAQWLQ
jgi:hypothetical protein